MKKIMLGVAAAALMTTAASASVDGDAATGWFVGKGDVQTAFGWNNATLQTEAGDVSFRYDTSADYDVTCEWDTENKKGTIHHSVTNTKTFGLSSILASSGRLKNQITGFNVGAAGSGGGDEAPSVGDSCPNGGDGLVTEVGPLGSSGGGLYVVWEGQEVLLQAAS